MDTYEDYHGYILDHKRVINDERDNCSNLYSYIEPILRVLNYVYSENSKHSIILPELEEIFDLGYGYLSNTLEIISSYYKDYLDENPVLLKEYSSLISYELFLDDLKCYLEEEGTLDYSLKDLISSIQNDISNTICNKEEVGNKIEGFEGKINKEIPSTIDYYPTQLVFNRICEELDLYTSEDSEN